MTLSRVCANSFVFIAPLRSNNVMCGVALHAERATPHDDYRLRHNKYRTSAGDGPLTMMFVTSGRTEGLMDIELGIQNVARPVNFSTDESADNVSQAIAQAWPTTRPPINRPMTRAVASCRQGTRLRDHRLRNQARRRLRHAVTMNRA